MDHDEICMRNRGWEVDGSGSESYPLTSFCISGVEPSGSATRGLVNL
jgi:hypothetical protein